MTFLLWKERTYPLNFKLQGDTAIISEPAVSQVLSCTWSHFIVTVIILLQAGKVGPWPHAPTFQWPKETLICSLCYLSIWVDWESADQSHSEIWAERAAALLDLVSHHAKERRGRGRVFCGHLQALVSMQQTTLPVMSYGWR